MQCRDRHKIAVLVTEMLQLWGCPIGSAKDCRGQVDDGLTIDNRRNWRGGGLEGVAEGRLCRRVELNKERKQGLPVEQRRVIADKPADLSSCLMTETRASSKYGTGARTKASAETGCADCVRVSFGSGSVQLQQQVTAAAAGTEKRLRDEVPQVRGMPRRPLNGDATTVAEGEECNVRYRTAVEECLGGPGMFQEGHWGQSCLASRLYSIVHALSLGSLASRKVYEYRYLSTEGARSHSHTAPN